MDNNTLYIHKNGTYMNQGDPTSGTNGYSYKCFKRLREVLNTYSVTRCWNDFNFGNGYFGTTSFKRRN